MSTDWSILWGDPGLAMLADLGVTLKLSIVRLVVIAAP